MLRKGSDVEVISDGGSDPHGVDIGSVGTVTEIHSGKPGDEPMWREDGAKCYKVDFGAMTQLFWPEEIKRHGT